MNGSDAIVPRFLNCLFVFYHFNICDIFGTFCVQTGTPCLGEQVSRTLILWYAEVMLGQAEVTFYQVTSAYGQKSRLLLETFPQNAYIRYQSLLLQCTIMQNVIEVLSVAHEMGVLVIMYELLFCC